MDIKNNRKLSELWQARIMLDGNAKSLRKVKEELAELIVAISHLEDGRGSFYEVFDEVADVTLQIDKLVVLAKDKKYRLFCNKQIQKKYDYLESITL